MLAEVSSGEWTAVAAGITALFGFFGVLIKALLDTQKDAQQLRDSVIKDLIPAITTMNMAAVTVTDTARDMITALAVAQVRRDNNPRSQR